MKLRFALFVLGLCCLPQGVMATTTDKVPLRFEYGFIRQALLAWGYEGKPKLTVYRDGSGCNHVTLSDPMVKGNKGLLHLSQKTEVKLGTAINGECVYLLDWQGRLDTWHRPQSSADGLTLRFPVTQSRLVDPAGNEIPAGPLLDQARRFAEPRLNHFSVDLKPPLEELKTLLPQVLPQGSPQLSAILQSLKVGEITADEDALHLSLRFTTPELAAAEPPEPPLTDQELARWQSAWQQWDAFLTAAIKQAAADAKMPILRRQLESVLIDARYLWQTALTSETPAGRVDPVRTFFLQTWDQLAPVFTALTAQLPAERGLQYVAFINAVDTLKVLDALGPALGLDISSDGLRRLARILIHNGGDPLQYQEAVDPELRRLFGLPPEDAEPLGFLWLDWIVAPAHAAPLDRTLVSRLNRWAPDSGDAGRYLPLVRRLLLQVAENVMRDQPVPAEFGDLYKNLIQAAAWQESCWRQFINQSGKLRPLVSPTGDVGIFQVNVRIWRGLYHPTKLRNDISYNARAGSEILRHYLVDYAIAKREHRRAGNREALARSAYAMYNGGPRHLSRYRNRSTPARLRQIDQAFWEKYQQIRRRGFQAVAVCFGDEPTLAQGSPRPKSFKSGTTKKAVRKLAGAAWIQRQNPKHFTLQLAALQDENSAKALLKHINAGDSAYFRFRRNNQTWYAVIAGIYSSRTQAQRAADSLRHKLALKNVWVRDFASLHRLAR